MDRGGRAVSSTGLRTAGPAAVAGPGDPATLTAIDRFVLERLEREGLAPAREAAPETWLRRASLDLIGLPPALRELDEFGADVGRRGEAAYAAAVDRLLASPHFGERQAIEWLDAARYADTHGFNNDSARTMWRWRDWVIDAFNANPLRSSSPSSCGRSLPQPTLEQRIATGFGRNHVINSEGGIIDEEYRVEYVADRVRTSAPWLGSHGVRACHDTSSIPSRSAILPAVCVFQQRAGTRRGPRGQRDSDDSGAHARQRRRSRRRSARRSRGSCSRTLTSWRWREDSRGASSPSRRRPAFAADTGVVALIKQRIPGASLPGTGREAGIGG